MLDENGFFVLVIEKGLNVDRVEIIECRRKCNQCKWNLVTLFDFFHGYLPSPSNATSSPYTCVISQLDRSASSSISLECV